MSARPVIAILVTAFVAGLAGAAVAATQEYTITVPLTLRGVPRVAGQKTITVTCAVGPASMAYSTETGGATGASGEGRVVVTIASESVNLTQNVVVTVTDAQTYGGTARGIGSRATTYLCWGKFSPASTATPVNFISGRIN